MKNTIQISRKKFVTDVLMKWNFGAQPATIQYLTKPKISSEGKKRFGEVVKIANINVMLGYSYEGSVNNQRKREEKERDFLAQPLWNGNGFRINSVLSKNRNTQKVYLSYKKQRTLKSFYFDVALNLLDTSVLKPYFPKSNPKISQGVDNPVFHREIAIENLRKVKFRKTTYVLTD